MTAGTFPESIAGRDLFIADASLWDTGTAILPNGDLGTRPANLNGTSSYVESGAHEFAMPWGVSDWSLELWVNYIATHPGTGANLVGRYRSDGIAGYGEFDLYQIGLSAPNIALRLGVYGGGFSWVDTAPGAVGGMPFGPEGNGWHHLVHTVNTSLGSGAGISGRRILSYKDGNLLTTTACPTSAITTPALSGPRLFMGTPGYNTDYIERAKLAIYHRELTAAEVMDHYLAMTT